jgi:acid phosphatase (class A)
MTLRPRVEASLRLLATIAVSGLLAALLTSADAQQPAPHPQSSRATSPAKAPPPVATGGAAATGGAPATSEVSRRPALGGYLGEQRLPDYRLILPPPPAAGSPLAAADAAIFDETRKLENGPRWQLAQNDDRIDLKALLVDFGCSTGVDLSSVDAPALTRVLVRSSADLFPLVGAAKDAYKRPRPFAEREGAICVMPSEDLAASPAYPSGHAATGWLYALLLAEIDPSHADAIVQRGRAFGESRVVCGVRYYSDIEGGRILASALVAALHGAPEFETDIASARAEMFSLRGKPPAAAACESEKANLATPW